MPHGVVEAVSFRIHTKAGEYCNKEVQTMYAIIATGGKQYKVSEGDIIKVEKIAGEAGDTVTFDQVVLVSDGSVKVGADAAKASVSATVMKQGRDRKVIVYKYKPKSGYHKKNGHRQAFTQVKIDKIKA